MTQIPELYCERQRGDKCRVHVINNLFGEPCLDDDTFAGLCAEYDRRVENSANTLDFDDFQSSQTFILPYVLETKFGLTSFWIAPFEFEKLRRAGVLRTLLDVLDFEQNRFLVMTVDHAWCVVKHNDGQWYKIDSLQGASMIRDPNDLVNNPMLGFLMPWGIARALRGVSEMRLLLARIFGQRVTRQHVCQMLVEDLGGPHPTFFGDAQTWLALFFRFLRFVDRIGVYTVQIRLFMSYEKKRQASPRDIVNAIEMLPFIITFVINEYNGTRIK